jgi:hypothetical protein
MEQNQGTSQLTPTERIQRLIERRDELLLARDILTLELEIRDLKQEKTNGDSNTKENKG